MAAVLKNEARAAGDAGSERGRLRDLVRARSFARGEFTLASGKKSTVYFNLKPTMMTPEGAYLAARALLAEAWRVEARFVVGLEMGAVPIIAAVAALSHEAGRPVGALFVRKKAKDHGTRLTIEGLAPGESIAGERVLAVDDVTTSGGSVLKAIEAARDAGAVVEDAVSLLDREEGAAAALAEAGVRLSAILSAGDFL